MMLLHGGLPFDRNPRFMEMMSQRYELFVPSHPGYGNSVLPDRFENVDDLAYLYLDLLEQFNLSNVVLVGFCLGGWVAAELAVRCCHRLSKLILVGPVGIKLGDRETRDFPDLFALSSQQVIELIYHDKSLAPANFESMSDDQLRMVAREREAFALYGWEPYLHNPRLKYRLHRIRLPVLLARGASDGLVSQSYVEGYARLLPDARVEVIGAAGHMPQCEQPAALAEKIIEFAKS
jgi:pimeloyl-ACP methyl ester carboxylesterase